MIFAWQEIPCENFALFSASPHNSFLRLYSQEIRDLCDLHCFNNISLGFMEIEGVSLYITKPWLNPYLEPEIGWKEMYSQTLTFSRLRAEKFYLKRKFSRPNNSTLPFQDDQFYKPRQISRLILICHENVASSLLFNLAGKVVRVSIDPMETDETRGDPSTRRLTT